MQRLWRFLSRLSPLRRLPLGPTPSSSVAKIGPTTIRYDSRPAPTKLITSIYSCVQMRSGGRSAMAALTMPEIDDGPLRDLLLELHRLTPGLGGPVRARSLAPSACRIRRFTGCLCQDSCPACPACSKSPITWPDGTSGRRLRACARPRRSPVDGRRPRAVRRSCSRRAPTGQPFTLGRMKSTLLIVEGDGELPIAREGDDSSSPSRWSMCRMRQGSGVFRILGVCPACTVVGWNRAVVSTGTPR